MDESVQVALEEFRKENERLQKSLEVLQKENQQLKEMYNIGGPEFSWEPDEEL